VPIYLPHQAKARRRQERHWAYTMNDKRLIEDYLPIQAISVEASREKSVRKGHISTLHLWWARRPLVACRAAVYGALVPAERFRPKNGPEEKRDSLMRANAAKFVERLCKYPGNSSVIKEAQRHILEAHAERLTRETGKKVTVKDIEEGRAPRPKVLYGKRGTTFNNQISQSLCQWWIWACGIGDVVYKLYKPVYSGFSNGQILAE